MQIPMPPLDADGNPIIAGWRCPCCGADTPRVQRPGRPRVYCTNACRQKMYRFRRRHGIRLLHGDGQPAHRAAGARVTHLVRPGVDPVGHRRTSQRKVVSLCGAFSRPAADHAHLKPDFRFDDVHACFTCLDLTGAGVPDEPKRYPWQMSQRDDHGPALEPVAVEPGAMHELRRTHGRPAWR